MRVEWRIPSGSDSSGSSAGASRSWPPGNNFSGFKAGTSGSGSEWPTRPGEERSKITGSSSKRPFIPGNFFSIRFSLPQDPAQLLRKSVDFSFRNHLGQADQKPFSELGIKLF